MTYDPFLDPPPTGRGRALLPALLVPSATVVALAAVFGASTAFKAAALYLAIAVGYAVADAALDLVLLRRRRHLRHDQADTGT